MGTIYAAVSKGEGRRLERRKKALEGREKMFAYRGGAQPHDVHDVQQRAVREKMLLAGAVFSIPSKQRNAKISLGMHSYGP